MMYVAFVKFFTHAGAVGYKKRIAYTLRLLL